MSKEEFKKYTISTVFPNEEIMNDALNRKSADEMFKELGYKKLETIWEEDNQIHFITYTSDDTYIEFNLDTKWMEITNTFNMQELQAINEKCKELGWYE